MNSKIKKIERSTLEPLRGEEKPPVYLDYEQLLIGAIIIMNATGKLQVAVYADNRRLGTISKAEIVTFLDHNPQNKLRSHKLCFTVGTLLALMRKNYQSF